jgi:outer membrane protein TolC
VEDEMLFIRALVLLLFFSTLSYSMDLTISEAKDLVLKNSLVLKSYKEKLKAATYKKYQANGAYAPKVTLSQSYVNTDEPGSAAFFKTMQSDFTMNYFMNDMADPDRVENYETKITIIQPIFMNGKIYFGRKQAVEMEKVSELQYKRTTEYVLYNLHKAFYGVFLSKKAVEVAKESLKRTEKYYNTTKNFFENGMIVRSDLLVAESHLLKNEEMLKDMEKQYHVAMSQLQRMIDTDEDINLIWETPKDIELGDLNTYIAAALENRKDLKSMNSMLNVTNFEINKVKSKFAPEVYAFADYRQNDENIFGNAGSGTTVGIQLNWNLFNGFSDRNKVMETKSNQLSLLHKIADMKLKIKVEVKNAYYSYDAAKKKLEAAEKRFEASKRALKITENRFNEGIAKITDLLDREVDFKQAELGVYMAKYDVIINKIALEFATGTLN